MSSSRGLTEGLSLKDAVREACAAGAPATTKPGAVPSLPTRVEILSLVQPAVGKHVGLYWTRVPKSHI
ncbi:MAG: hypothetical protein R3C24_13940 [Cyanobacteriota/Melainabacteria group bacterium]